MTKGAAIVNEYFYRTASRGAPFFSDVATGYVGALNAPDAITALVERYDHPAGLYSAQVWPTADDYHRGAPALGEWLSTPAAIRRNGLPCPVCGNPGTVSVGNVEQGWDELTCEDGHRFRAERETAQTVVVGT